MPRRRLLAGNLTGNPLLLCLNHGRRIPIRRPRTDHLSQGVRSNLMRPDLFNLTFHIADPLEPVRSSKDSPRVGLCFKTDFKLESESEFV
jgi:hypothetical protein